MKNKLFKKLVSSLVMACLLLSSFGVAMAATTSVASDIKGHWAESEISAWMDKGLIKGYEDGSFKPENQITRAEFIALINRSFGFTEETAIAFSDVPAGNWAYPEVAKAVKAGYITGYVDGTIGVSKPISRQEVAAIVDRLLGLSNAESAATSFTDSSTIASWAKASVDAAVTKGILKGYTDNSFKPSKSITRAEAVVTLDRAVAAKVTVYNTAGTYGPATGTQTINGDVVINVAGVTVQNLEINGKLLFAAGIGSGDAFLNNVTVKGDTTINGGGVNSLHFKNSRLAKVIIKAAKGPVRVVAEGSTTVGLTEVSSPAVIQEDGTTGKGFGDVTLNKDLPTGSDVTLKGTFDNVIILGDKSHVELPDGTTITKFKTDADATVTGKGIIATAELGKDSKTTFETKPTATTIGGVAAPNPTPTPTPDPTPPVVQKGTVVGSVYKYNSKNEQIVGANVSVYSGIQGSGSLVSTVESGPDGEYSISNVPAGNFYLKFVKEGYMDLTITPVNHTVTGNATTDASKAYMYHNLVKGYVKDTSGNPISSVEVKLYDDSGDTDYNVFTSTAADGSFYFYDVPAIDSLYVYIETGLFRGIDSEIGPVQVDGLTDIGLIELKSENKKLSALALSGITFSPTFSSDKTYYTASVPFSVISTTVSATTMNAKATIHLNYEMGIAKLNEGFNDVQVYVNPESEAYYDIYTVQVYRETEAQAAAIGMIENYTGEDINLISVVNTATGLNNSSTAIDENFQAYRSAIIAAANGALDTSQEIAALVQRINNEAQSNAIAKIEAVTDDESAKLITINDLNLATGLRTAFGYALNAYKQAIVAAESGALDTSDKIAALIKKVNDSMD
ncbi:hypothetical protein Back11_43410 [Paenibacillus baekrokdamisoli]|uniref:Uncharacterized protein n=1 Tax=Paenibacillus baekrokdamisoli TaxID=1712516 RepID=A0A3G9IWV2_9BACL|nr:S-layer homology domain-containing protein [Paenibacillus baekrokdamisoli]MBB3067957.1 hypothetical protein [Paenibacillus baekrokdamisoli]BBH22996.1 hypothetical protein Back11_43410 [Paenibacillus baekrokdamisoli]